MLKSILVLGTGIAIGMCMYKKKGRVKLEVRHKPPN